MDPDADKSSAIDDAWTVVSAISQKTSAISESGRSGANASFSSAGWVHCQCGQSLAASSVYASSEIASLAPSRGGADVRSALTSADAAVAHQARQANDALDHGCPESSHGCSETKDAQSVSSVSSLSYMSWTSACPTCGVPLQLLKGASSLDAPAAPDEALIFERMLAPRFQRPRFAKWAGKSTVRKTSCSCCTSDSDTIEIVRPRVNVVTEMDVFLFESHPAPLLRSRVTLAKSKRWELERQLEELAVGTPARTTDRAGNETITYELPITGEIVGAHMKAALAKQWETHQRQRTIFEVVHHGDPFRMRAIGAFPAEAPDTTLQELDFKLRTNIGNGRDEMCVRDAKCRLGNYGAFFSPGGNARVHLEAHFDQPVRVSAVSTAARRAPRRSFPDQLWIEKHRSQARWKGDSYYILDRSATNASDVLFFPEYKLAYRPSRGAPWIPLGTFKGPRNNFEERLQTLEMADNLNERTSIRCIALRWTVSTEHEDMAKRGLRVAVFGPPDADNGKAVVSDPRDFASQGGSRRKESTVQYVLTKATVSHRKKKQGRSFYGRYDYDFKTSAKADRIRRAKEARGAIKDYNAK